MIDFVGIPQLLRITLCVVIKAMHFYVAQIYRFIFGIFCMGGNNEQFVIHGKLSWVQGRSY